MLNKLEFSAFSTDENVTQEEADKQLYEFMHAHTGSGCYFIPITDGLFLTIDTKERADWLRSLYEWKER
jgi:hypothetical protein